MKKSLSTVLVGLAGFAAFADVGRAQWASEVGFAIIQQQCMKCHGKLNMPQAPGVAVLREISGEKIYELLTAASNSTHQALNLSDDDKRHVAESLSGRLLGSALIGDAKLMPNRCSANPPLGDPLAGPVWNGWGNGSMMIALRMPALVMKDQYTQPVAARRLWTAAADQVPKLKLKWAFGLPGARSGMLYALSAMDGHSLWQFDTAQDFTTVNKIPARGGTIGSAGPTVVAGMLFVGSGYSFGGGDKNGNVLLAFSTE